MVFLLKNDRRILFKLSQRLARRRLFEISDVARVQDLSSVFRRRFTNEPDPASPRNRERGLRRAPRLPS